MKRVILLMHIVDLNNFAEVEDFVNTMFNDDGIIFARKTVPMSI